MMTQKKKVVRRFAVKDLSKSRMTKIKKLHEQMVGFFKKSLGAVIDIGQELTAQKKEAGHGAWLKWCEGLPFSLSTAERWMKLYRDRSKPGIVNVTNLTVAYRLISGGVSGETAEATKQTEDGNTAEEAGVSEKVFRRFKQDAPPLSETYVKIRQEPAPRSVVSPPLKVRKGPVAAEPQPILRRCPHCGGVL